MRQAYIPMTAVAEIVNEWIDRNNTDEDKWTRRGVGGLRKLAEISGVPERRIYCIRRGFLIDGHRNNNKVYTEATFDTVDRLLVAMDMQHEWHMRLADYYEMPIPPNHRERLLEREAA